MFGTRHWICFGVVGVWLGACGLGMGALSRYAGTAGDAGEPAGAWPLVGSLGLDDERPTVVLFAHPRCPCTRATLAELERLRGRWGERFAFRALFFEPDGAAPAWRETALWRKAGAIGGAVVQADPGGRMSAACGATTSGLVGVYGPDGSLLFWGGVTASRGHEGRNAGLDAVEAIVSGGWGDVAQTGGGRPAVYGCSLLGSCGPRGETEARP